MAEILSNPTLQAIFDRRSIRKYAPEPLTEDQLETLVQVALASPTARDRQAWHFAFVADPARIAEVSGAAIETFRRNGDQAVLDRLASRGGGLFYEAPLVVFVSCPGDDHDYKGLDCGIAVENLAIAATSMGLGSCIIAMARAAFQGEAGDALARRIGMPDGASFAISIAIGRAAVGKDPHPRDRTKVTVLRPGDR